MCGWCLLSYKPLIVCIRVADVSFHTSLCLFVYVWLMLAFIQALSLFVYVWLKFAFIQAFVCLNMCGWFCFHTSLKFVYVWLQNVNESSYNITRPSLCIFFMISTFDAHLRSIYSTMVGWSGCSRVETCMYTKLYITLCPWLSCEI